jgi:hypothetical protein
MITTLAVDDVYAAKGEKIEAFDTVFIWWDSQWFELHLTQGNIAMLEKSLRPYLDVARKSKGPKSAEPPRHAGKPKQKRPRGKDRRDWTGFKAWCDSAGRTYVSAGGHFWPRVQDQKDYEQWLADHPANAPGEREPGNQDAHGHTAAQVA